MAAEGDISGMRREAYHYAYISNTYAEGYRTTAFYNPWTDKAELATVYDRAYTRASRVRYMVESNQGYFISRNALGCPDGGNFLAFNVMVNFTDEDGNHFQQWYNTVIPMENHIGGNNASARIEVLNQLRDRYFQGKTLAEVSGMITGYTLTNVRCLVA